MKIRYVIVAIIAIIVFERITRVECYSVNYNKVECVNYKNNEKWTEKSVNH